MNNLNEVAWGVSGGNSYSKSYVLFSGSAASIEPIFGMEKL